MRTSTLSRSVMAVASLAIGSAAFAAVPANAATYNGITRTEVLTATNEARAAFTSEGNSVTPAVTALAAKACGVPLAQVRFALPSPVETPDSVDGLTVTAFRQVAPTDDENSFDRTCTFSAIAALGAKTTLAGEAVVITDSVNSEGTTSTETYALSGDVFASPAVVSTDSFTGTSIAASGIATGAPSAAVLTKVKKADKKSKADKRAAKKAYSKRLKAIKKVYTKALKKAGSSTSKKSMARATYRARRASAKQAYRYAVAPYKFVNVRSKQADGVRFSISVYSYFGLG